ncbi:MAG: SWIM zinc finger family protein, partial [Trebonia sp.]
MADMAMVLVFTEESIEEAAGHLSFERGLQYLDRVDNLEGTSTEITATVYGTDPYQVTLTAWNRQLSGECSCPHGQDGFFCKHCVAVGLTVARRDGGSLKIADSGHGAAVAAASVGQDALEAWFAAASKDELVEE